jgi:hypothetical protein
VISCYLVILLAFGAAAMRISQGAFTEAVGLAGLGAGLLCLKLGERQPALKRFARLGFAVTAIAIVSVLFRMWQARGPV